jgi:ParB family chromosome partitioning protein
MPEFKTEYRKPSELSPHPEQAKIFGDLPPHKFDELVENIRKERLKVPIEILPDGTMVCGHNRVRAAQTLGMETISVIVRHDLAAAGEAAVLQRMIEDNLVRRQLSPLAQARAYLALKQQQRAYPSSNLGARARDELRDQIGAAFDMSGRNVDRYLAVLRTPRAVQDAFDQGRLPLNLAARVSTLATPAQKGIEAAIVSDPEADPAGIVKEALSRRLKPKPAVLGRALAKLVAEFERGMQVLAGPDKELKRSPDELGHDISILHRFSMFIPGLLLELAAIRTKKIKDAKELKDLMDVVRERHGRPVGRR